MPAKAGIQSLSMAGFPSFDPMTFDSSPIPFPIPIHGTGITGATGQSLGSCAPACACRRLGSREITGLSRE